VRALVFALQFRGRGTQVGESRRRATTSASSQLHRTVLGASGIEAGLEAFGSDTATLEAEVELTGAGPSSSGGAFATAVRAA
jgi:hypothetical protein